ncbi:hypothetical protein ACF3MZ_24635 [Paenibacillaceae bacterium WGS1546]|uniref:hypothetical protein n=1 Tax=Cohnella sp. WGS1546 TaxID=3366810 RepID=UPI00372CF65C
MTMKNQKGVIVAICVLSVLVVSSFFIFQFNAGASKDDAREKRAAVEQLIKEWLIQTSNPSTLKSSLPSDYRSAEAFQKLSGLSIDYLPYLIEVIEKDESLTSYNLIHAATSVSKTKTDFPFARPHEWLDQWKAFVAGIPSFHSSLKNSADALVSIDRITELGAPIVPYLMDDVEEGNVTYVRALAEIVEDPEMPQSDDLTEWNTWVKQNRAKYEPLRFQP